MKQRQSLAIAGAAVTLLLVGSLVWLMSQPADALMPHGFCYQWIPALVRVHEFSDLLIGCSYVSISLTLGYVVARARQALPFHWMFLAFGLFIIACGGTHFVEAWTIWHPSYWFAAWLKIVTAVASLTTAILLPPLVPRVLAFIESARLQGRQKEALEREIEQRLLAEAGLRKMQETLEQNVRDRTSRLSQANSALTLYESIFNTSSWGVAIVDSVRGLIQLANPAFARMHGYEPDEMLGFPIARTFAPDSTNTPPELDTIVKAHDHLMYESVHVNKSGRRFDCMTDVTLVRDPQGLPLFRLGYYQDVSGQRRAEEDIRSVVTHARCILWRANVTGIDGWDHFERGKRKFTWDLVVQDESAAQHLLPLEIPPDTTYSDVWRNCRHPEDMPQMDETAALALIRGSESYSQQYRAFDRNGAIMWIREEVAITKIEPGKWQCTGVCMDVTDEHRLMEQTRQQAELLELSHDAIIVRAIDGEIIYWNSGAEDLYGWHRKEVLGQIIHNLLATGAPQSQFDAALKKDGYWAGRLSHRTKEGNQITVESRHLLVRRADGQQVILETNRQAS